MNYKNMPLLQLAVNFPPLLAGCLVKYFFFLRSGFGKDYREGLMEGLRTAKQQTKVPFHLRHLPWYFQIEWELIRNTVTYFKEWFTKKKCRLIRHFLYGVPLQAEQLFLYTLIAVVVRIALLKEAGPLFPEPSFSSRPGFLPALPEDNSRAAGV